MTTPRPPQPPVMQLIEQRRKRLGYSFKTAGRLAGMSDTRWRQLEAGYRVFKQVAVEEQANDRALARMAQAVRVDPRELAQAGYPEAAEILATFMSMQAEDDVRNAQDAAQAASAVKGLTDRQRAALETEITESLRRLREG
jgi:hypothetical protein